MREHKHRAWDKEAKCMIGWDRLCDMMETGKIELLERQSLKRDWPDTTIKTFSRTGNPFKNPHFILMQFTDLKDRNGKDLDWWEGDIIQKGEIVRAITVDCEHGLRFMLGKHQLCRQDGINGTKIGTVHDNPELLEAKK